MKGYVSSKLGWEKGLEVESTHEKRRRSRSEDERRMRKEMRHRRFIEAYDNE